MQKRTAFIGAILSLIPLGHPLMIKTGVVLSTTGLILSIPEKVNAESANFYFDRGYKKYVKGDYYGSISDFTKAIEIDPKDSGAYYNRAIVKHDLEDYYRAISDYTKAIEIDPNYKEAYYNRGLVKEDLNDNYGAISDYTKAIEIDPNYAKSYNNRGRLKHSLEDYYGAISDFIKAIEIDPNYALAYSNLAVTKGEGFEDDEGACSDIKKAALLGDKYRIDWLETSEGKWCQDM